VGDQTGTVVGKMFRKHKRPVGKSWRMDKTGAIKSEVQHLPRVRCAHAKKKNVSTASA
jgi:hypothetical protein